MQSSSGATAASHSAAGESSSAAACAVAPSSSSFSATARCQSTVGASTASSSCCAPARDAASSSSAGAAVSPVVASAAAVAPAAPAAIPFPFPYPPYPQQLALMTHIFQTIEQGKGHVCIVESPTGTGQAFRKSKRRAGSERATQGQWRLDCAACSHSRPRVPLFLTPPGKSLSLISACLYWLLEHHPREQAQAAAAAAAAAAASASSSQCGSAPSWVATQHLELQAKSAAKKAADQAILQASITKQLQKRATEEARQRKQQAARDSTTAALYDPDADLLPDDVGPSSSSAAGGGGRVLSFAQQLELDDLEEKQEAADKLLRELVLDQSVPYARKASVILERQARAARIATITGGGGSGGDAQVDELGGMLSRMLAGDRPRRKPQIIYASRTHSQLIQFVSEIKKTKYGQKLQVRPNVIPAPSTTTTQQQPSAALKAFAHSNKPVSSSSVPATGTLTASAAAASAVTVAAAPASLVAKVISLGSRSNLCVHPLTQHLKQHPLQLNDVCMDMQKNKPSEQAGAQPKVVAIAIDKNKVSTE